MKKEVKIRFKSKERKMLSVLNKKYGLTIFTLSAKFQVEARTIVRWIEGGNNPPYSTRIMIARMYEEFENEKDV